MAAPKTKKGGARPGAGRKKKAPLDYEEKFKREIKRTLNKLKRQHDGETFLEAGFKLMWDKKVQDSVKASLLKTYAEIFAVKKAETKVDVNQITGPGIMLPAESPDPTEEIG